MIFHPFFRHIETSFTVDLIAQPLTIYSCEQADDSAIGHASDRKYDVVPFGRIRSDGSFWVDELIDRTSASSVRRAVAATDLVASSTPLMRLLTLLIDRSFYLVLVGERVQSIVTRSDLNLLPVRVLLFTVLAHIEMVLTEDIAGLHPEDSWLSLLEPNQQRNIRKVQRTKIEQKMDTRLLDCASLGMKCAIVEATPGLLSRLGYASGDAFHQDRKIFERIRNQVHHGQTVKPAADLPPEPEDELRDAIAHNDRLIASSEDIRWVRDALHTLLMWIDRLAPAV